MSGPAPSSWEPWQAGAYYAARGFAVVPLVAKSPAVFGHNWWERRITRVGEAVKIMFQANYTNVGLATGCGFFAVDVDHAELLPEEVGAELQGSAINVTRPGRQHHLFSHPDGDPPSGSTYRFPGEGWGEVRGKGGQIVGWGPHPDGENFYQFDPDQTFTAPSARLASWLTPASARRSEANTAEVADFLARYTEIEKYGVRALDAIIVKGDRLVGAASTGLHENLFVLMPWAMREAAAGRYPAEMARERLQSWWDAHWTARARAGAEGRTQPEPDEFDRCVAWAIGQVLDDLEPEREPEPDDGPTEPVEEEAPKQGLFVWHETADDVADIPPIEFSVIGMWPLPTYGVTAGTQKSLKSTLATGRAVALAAGVSVFNHFTVPHPRPVLYLVGEGGRSPWLRSVKRWQEFYRVEREALRLFRYTTNTAPLNSDVFLTSVLDAMERLEKLAGTPGVVVLDPKYAYQAHDVDTRMLGEQGAALAGISGPIVETGWTLDVIDHFNKTGKDVGLARITGAGMAEWADSWTLVAHRLAPDVMGGHFWLNVSLGSRQWGGMEWEFDIDIGTFNLETAEHEGSLDIRIRPAETGPVATAEGREESRVTGLGLRIVELLRDAGMPLPRTTIKKEVKGDDNLIVAAINRGLERGGLIEVSLEPDSVGRPRTGITENPAMHGEDDL